MRYELSPLPYSFDALEPHIDEMTMRLHHDKHHATYVSKLNEAVEAAAVEDLDLVTLLSDLSRVPLKHRPAIKNHGGGHLNHAMFWNSLSPEPELMGSSLHQAVANTCGDTDIMCQKIREEGLKVFGSGWVWLVLKDEQLQIATTKDQDNPLMYGMLPLLGIDVWEHAYYLRYQNRRPDYLEAVMRVIDWSKVSERYDALVSKGPSALLDELH